MSAPTLNTTLAAALATLAGALDLAERRAVALLLEHPGPAAGVQPWPYGALEDHRVAVLGDLADALDMLINGSGARLFRIAHPHLPRLGLDLDDEQAQAQARYITSACTTVCTTGGNSTHPQ